MNLLPDYAHWLADADPRKVYAIRCAPLNRMCVADLETVYGAELVRDPDGTVVACRCEPDEFYRFLARVPFLVKYLGRT